MQTTVPASTCESGHVVASAQHSAGLRSVLPAFFTAARLIQRGVSGKAAFVPEGVAGCIIPLHFTD